MDPNKCLETILSVVNQCTCNLSSSDVEELVEAVRALDEWMSMGGAKPSRWSRNDWIQWAKENEGRGI